MSGKVFGTIAFLAFACLVTSFVSAGVGKLYERGMSFTQHLVVSLICWICVFVPGTIFSIIHSEFIRIPALIEFGLMAATLVVAALLMTHLARSWYGVTQALGVKVIPTMLGIGGAVIVARLLAAS